MNYTFCHNQEAEQHSLLSTKNQSITVTDTQILELQELFLCNGIHTIHVSDMNEGRCIIYSFLEALRCFNLVGCFTSDANIPANFYNIYSYFKKNNFFNNHNCGELEQFFIEDFNFNFIWIEGYTMESKNFLKKIEKFKIDLQLPIILLIN